MSKKHRITEKPLGKGKEAEDKAWKRREELLIKDGVITTSIDIRYSRFFGGYYLTYLIYV